METNEQNPKAGLLKAYRDSFWAPLPGLGESLIEPYALLALAASYLRLQDYAEANNLLVLAIKRQPSNPDPHWLFGRLHENAGSYEEAAFAYLEALKLEDAADGDRVFEFMDAITGAVEKVSDKGTIPSLLERLLKQHPSSPLVLEIQASVSWQLHEFRQAESSFRELLKRTDDSEELVDLRYRLSLVLIAAEKYDEGISLLEKALPCLGSGWDYAEVERKLADAYLMAKRFEPALKIYLDHSASYAPGLTKAQVLKKASQCYETLGAYDRAIDCLVEILTFICEAAPPDASWLQRHCVISDRRFFREIYEALARCYGAAGDSVRAEAASGKAEEYAE